MLELILNLMFFSSNAHYIHFGEISPTFRLFMFDKIADDYLFRAIVL